MLLVLEVRYLGKVAIVGIQGIIHRVLVWSVEMGVPNDLAVRVVWIMGVRPPPEVIGPREENHGDVPSDMLSCLQNGLSEVVIKEVVELVVSR